MTLEFAQRCADRLMDWLSPLAERIEIAGSIRRRRPDVGDIDLVAIPKVEMERDLLGSMQARRNLMAAEVRSRCGAEGWELQRDGEQCMIWVAKGVQVDLWFASHDTWGTLLLCRTGSRAHNIQLAMRAMDQGGKWNPHHGLFFGRTRIAASEESIYAALDLPMLDPARHRDPASASDGRIRYAPRRS